MRNLAWVLSLVMLLGACGGGQQKAEEQKPAEQPQQTQPAEQTQTTTDTTQKQATDTAAKQAPGQKK